MLIRGPEGRILGRGLVAYDSADAAAIIGRSSREIAAASLEGELPAFLRQPSS